MMYRVLARSVSQDFTQRLEGYGAAFAGFIKALATEARTVRLDHIISSGASEKLTGVAVAVGSMTPFLSSATQNRQFHYYG